MEETKAKTNIISTPAAILIAGVIIAGAIVWTNGRGAPSNVAAVNSGQEPQAGPAVDASKVKTDGKPFIGNPNAPITIAYWMDYQCPFCRQHEETSMSTLIKDYINTGKARLVFKDFQFLGPDSQTIGKYARAVWTVAPAKFYAWHKAIFDNQGTENSGWATKDKLVSITKNVLGESDTNKVADLVVSNSTVYQKDMDADKAEGMSFGVNGTPAMIIGKKLVSGAVPYEQIKSAIEVAISGK